MRPVFFSIGIFSVAAGTVGAFLPLLPTVPFMILAAYCFARANPAWEQRLLDDARFGPHIRAWRQGGRISRSGKIAALGSLLFSAALGLYLLDGWHQWVPSGAAVLAGGWLWTRPSA